MSTIYISLFSPSAIMHIFIDEIFWTSVGLPSSCPNPYLLKKLEGINIDDFYDFLFVSIQAFLLSPFGENFALQSLDSYS